MAPHPPKPLVSTRADDPEVSEQIDAFVMRLGETVDGLQDAEASGELALLEERAAALAGEADTLGYPPMVELAARVRAAAREGGAEGTHKAVEEVTEMAKRIRRGHRSAA
jgi:hypothetical protein